jgi:Fe-S oxidoreductase
VLRGGGRMWMEEKLGTRINQERMREIEGRATQTVGLSCPYCMIMLGNAKEEIGASTAPFDVLELARRSMGTGAAAAGVTALVPGG